MEYQILLLPRTDYWLWLRACREYVMAFGAGLTDDPGVAARHMAPRQVISFPNRRDAFPELGEAERWFQNRHPGIRLDVIDADSPSVLGSELRRRVDENDRYGARRRPFYLLWPTDYPVVTQPFGANPRIYRRYGMPGHEGVDFRALTNTNVYACAEGEVYEVHAGARDHAYGIHVRLQHRDGYKTVYAHLAQALVRKGDRVQPGQVIGRADSTGNSSASHLHLSLKRDGATARKETPYPKDLIDPTPFLVWPAQKAARGKGLAETSSAPIWEPGRCLIGVARASRDPVQSGEMDAVRAGRAEAVMLDGECPAETVREMAAARPGILFVARLSVDPLKAKEGSEVSAAAIAESVRRLHALGVRDFELQPEPNLTEAGLGLAWASGAEFGRWFSEVADRIRSVAPDARVGFPMLSPGESIQGKRRGLADFLSEAEEAVVRADWIGVGCFWTSPSGLESPMEGRLYEQYLDLFPDGLLILTGVGPLDGKLTLEEEARQVARFVDGLTAGGRVAAAFVGATRPSDSSGSMTWTDESGRVSALARALAKRK